MRIKMAGIDYRKAPVQVRELFSMTASAAVQTLKNSIKRQEITGCIVISTCNRTEYWISGESEDFDELDPAELLCLEKGQDYEKYRACFSVREGRKAVHYLMELCCGLRSQIFGDDQIISQVKRAVDMAREEKALDSALEILFRMAVTGAKRVKSQMPLVNVDRSVAAAMTTLLKKEQISVAGKRCLVIGNGEIGRLAASELLKAGGEVFMTLRRYKVKEVTIPAGCRVIDYEARYEHLGEMEIVVSATVSPHYTLTREKAESSSGGRVYVDLAIPRDIEPEIGKLPGAKLYDMDSFTALKYEGDERQIEKADEILKKYEQEYAQWYEFRDYVPRVKAIAHAAGADTAARLKKELRQYPLSDGEREALLYAIEGAASRVVAKLCYSFRDEMEPEIWSEVFHALGVKDDGEQEA